jgi:hypothetical protein
MDAAVDWKNLSDAVAYFTSAGYRYVEVPWSVPGEITRVTCPEERWIVSSSLGDLVGSAEQSFMHLKREGQLGPGKFVACSPCFRNEDTVDDLHQRTFMKVELYQDADMSDPLGCVQRHVSEVVAFHRTLLPGMEHHLTIRRVGPLAIDIELDGIEIGSYGVRSWNGCDWLYGTAIAEPRFTSVKKRLANYTSG